MIRRFVATVRQSRTLLAESVDDDTFGSIPGSRLVAAVVVAANPHVLLEIHEEQLDPNTNPKEKRRIPKTVVPTLPSRFERARLADVPEEAVASYRDMTRKEYSTHVNEFPEYWELHVDRVNPEYTLRNGQSPLRDWLLHLVADAPDLTTRTVLNVFRTATATSNDS